MTIASTINRNGYTGNGSTDTYNYTFKLFLDTDMRVVVREVATGEETVLIYETDYNLTGVGEEEGGTLVLLDAGQDWIDGSGYLASGWVISLRRVLDLVQETDIRNQGDFFPEAHEDQFDKLVMIEQQQDDEIERSLKLPETIDPADFNGELPAAIVGTANSVLMTNDTGDGWKMGPTATDISSAQSFAEAADASKTDASEHATTASRWAKKTDGSVVDADTSVDSGEYSAKAYAVGGTGVTDTAGKGAAKEWATKTSSSVDTSEFSAKEYAQGSQAGTGGSAKDWAQKTASAVTGALYSAKEWAQGILTRGQAGGGSAKDWANYTGGTVDNSEYSAKKYAEDALAIKNSLSNALVATEDIAASGTVSINTNLNQNRKVQGNGAARTTSNQPFGSSVATDGLIVRLIGQSDVNTLTVPYSDTNYGCLLNGDATLRKGSVLTLLFDLTALRWYEISRNF